MGRMDEWGEGEKGRRGEGIARCQLLTAYRLLTAALAEHRTRKNIPLAPFKACLPAGRGEIRKPNPDCRQEGLNLKP